MSNVSESPYDLLMLSYQGNIVLLESEEMHTADLIRTVLAVTVITHTLKESFLNNTQYHCINLCLVFKYFLLHIL